MVPWNGRLDTDVVTFFGPVGRGDKLGAYASRPVASLDRDHEAIEQSILLFEAERGVDTFEVWEGRRMVYQRPASVPPTRERR